MARTNQGGSILGFLVIGGVLVATLVGGVYIIRQQMTAQPATTSQQPVSPVEQEKQESPSSTPAEPKPAETPKTESTPSQPEAAAPPAVPAPTDTAPSPVVLPKTGPAESLIAVLGLGLLSFASLSYVKSRQLVSRL